MRPFLVPVLLLALSAAKSPAASPEPGSPRALVAVGDAWRWARGIDAPADWREESFDDSAWRSGPSGFGYGDDDDATVVEDLKGRSLSLALRRRFEATRKDAASPLVLVVRSDDGFVAWLNGVEIARARVSGDPPALDAAAEDHEATRPERFPVPPGILRAGANLLVVQAHNSERSSSDFTIEPQLLVEPAAAPPRSPVAAARRALEWTTTLQAFHASNYFQGRAGSPKESVLGQAVRQEIVIRPRGSRLRLALRADLQRFGSLGTAFGASVRASWRQGRHEPWVAADALWNRPAFRAGNDVADGDSAGLQAGLLSDVGRSLRAAAWIDASRETLEIDSRRDNHDVLLGASLRFLRRNDAFSPELGIEWDRRTAGAPAFEYEQRRAFLRLRSRPTDRVALSGLLRWGLRDYAIDRDDRRRTARVTCDVSLTPRVDLVTFVSWEDGQSSLEGRAFEGTTAWAGVRFGS